MKSTRVLLIAAGLLFILVLVQGAMAAEAYGYVKQWGIIYGPTGIAADQSGNIYVAQDGALTIQKFTSDGTFVKSWGSYGGTEDGGTEPGHYIEINGIAVDSRGFVYIVDNMGAYKVLKYMSDGTFVSEWKITSGGPFRSGITVGPDDNIYVAADGNIQRFDPDGNLKDIIVTGGSDAIAVDRDGYIYAVSGDSLRKFTSNGSLVKTWTANYGPIAVDSSGNMIVADNDGHIRKYTSDGVFLTGWGEYGSGDGQFSDIAAMTVDSANNVYVAEWGNNRIQKFSRFLTGNIAVTSKPAGFPIYLDNVNTNHRTPYVLQNILPGLHTVTVKGKGLLDQNLQVVVYGDQVTNADFIMMPTLSVKLVTTPEPVAPGGTFSMNVILNHNGHGYFVDHSDTIITFDPKYVTIDSLPIMDTPWEDGGPCGLSSDTINCGGLVWWFPEVVNNELFFKNSITGKIKDNTPIGTNVKMNVCMWVDYDIYDVNSLYCDDSHYITVVKKSEVPEFPSILLSGILIIGFLGVVLFIQRTRER